MVKNPNDTRALDLDEIMESAYKLTANGERDPKTWCYCQDCIILGAYEWCPHKKETKTLNVEEGCPLGKRLLN